MSPTFESNPLLPDIIDEDIEILFVALAPSQASVDAGHYFTGDEVNLYRLLREAGLTPREFSPQEDNMVTQSQLGFTHLIKSQIKTDDIKPATFRMGSLIRIVFRFEPFVVCFLGKETYRHFFNRSTDFGPQRERIAEAAIFVAPLPEDDGGTQYSTKLNYYEELRAFKESFSA